MSKFVQQDSTCYFLNAVCCKTLPPSIIALTQNSHLIQSQFWAGPQPGVWPQPCMGMVTAWGMATALDMVTVLDTVTALGRNGHLFGYPFLTVSKCTVKSTRSV